MSLENPDARLAWLKEIAGTFPGEPQISMHLLWENDHGTAGVSIDQTGAYVFLDNSLQFISSMEEAVETLRGIFADKIVAVTAWSNGQPVHQCLGPAADPTLGFNVLDKPGGFNMPRIDEVTIENWSGGLQEQE